MAGDLKCPECGTVNPPGSILCTNCLADLEQRGVAEGVTCPTCGESNPEGSSECATCGQPFEEETGDASVVDETPPEIPLPGEDVEMSEGEDALLDDLGVPLDLPPIPEEGDLIPDADLPEDAGLDIEPEKVAEPGVGLDEIKTDWIDRELGLDEYVGEESLCPQCENIVSVYEDRCRNCGAIFITDTCRCEVCGELVPAEAITCPNCRAFMVEEETKCPVCNSIVSGSAPSCPVCGAAFASDEFRCAQCASIVDITEIICPSCGTLMKEGVKLKSEVVASASGAQTMLTSEVTVSPDTVTIAPEESKVMVDKVVVKAEIPPPQAASPAMPVSTPPEPKKKIQRDVFPFTAIVGQEMMKLALILNAVDTGIGGVLLEGQKGTAKSIAVRGLAELLPTFRRVQGCRFNCDPDIPEKLCWECRERFKDVPPEEIPSEEMPVRVIDLPLNATEDRVVGTINVERILTHGLKAFEHGLLAEANRGILYIDEINLLDDFIVDVLLDAAAMGVCTVEREGISVSYPAKFIIIGSMNPEEGALRPQLLDRIGMVVKVKGIDELDQRMEIVRRREGFDEDPDLFRKRYASQQEELSRRIAEAKRMLDSVTLPDGLVSLISRICLEFGVDGHRADITIQRGARAHAAFAGRTEVNIEDVTVAAELALPHRMKRRPFEEEEFTRERLMRVIEGLGGGGI